MYTHTQFLTIARNQIEFQTGMVKVCIVFQTKTAQKLYALGPINSRLPITRISGEIEKGSSYREFELQGVENKLTHTKTIIAHFKEGRQSLMKSERP